MTTATKTRRKPPEAPTAMKWHLGMDLEQMDRARREAEARKPTPGQERAIRTRLYQIGHTALVKRVLLFDGRLWNELVGFSDQFFVDTILAEFARSGYADDSLIGGPVPSDMSREEIEAEAVAAERAAIRAEVAALQETGRYLGAVVIGKEAALVVVLEIIDARKP